MASLEEEKLVQMVHEFIESEQEPEPEPSSLPISSINHSSTFILQGILGSYTKEEMEVMEKAKEFVREMKDEKMIQRSDIMKRRLMMSLRKHGFDASLCSKIRRRKSCKLEGFLVSSLN
ncbi:uncharacterized protein LOC120259304 isoform X2 [Dioscorea cayenensis subsp. rotundata]|uniref:Uncharacterized protein LOC120259304 isoform X2 n=1 Tax=Dioscorea cayennensis subsp. rotundata TaxID=55577 RepID=A0AB40B706_DIOCR|nr:uncharacterized protein LOC120259304 isoform X2 [Dioscorea cayenensis subsp. rotundata]